MRVLSLTLVVVAACGGSSTGTTTPPVQQPSTLVISSAPSFQLLAGQSATASVRVLSGSQPLAGIGVHFAPSAGGTVDSSQPATNADGIATVQWTTAKTVGQQTLVASIPNTIYSQQFVAEVSVSLAGTWTGTMPGAVVSVVCRDNPTPLLLFCDGFITLGSASARQLTFAGSINGAQFATSNAGVLYNGTIDPTGRIMTGPFTGSGYNAVTLTLTKQ